jgi:hypothetical protein
VVREGPGIPIGAESGHSMTRHKNSPRGPSPSGDGGNRRSGVVDKTKHSLSRGPDFLDSDRVASGCSGLVARHGSFSTWSSRFPPEVGGVKLQTRRSNLWPGGMLSDRGRRDTALALDAESGENVMVSRGASWLVTATLQIPRWKPSPSGDGGCHALIFPTTGAFRNPSGPPVSFPRLVGRVSCP